MPYYDYQCSDCLHRFSIKETFAEHDRHKQAACPKCGSKKVERVIHEVHVKTAKKS